MKLASVEKILDIKPHTNADSLELATILGWQVVVKKGEFKIGDLVVYVPIDTVLPEKPEFEFMRNKNFRVKTIKLRGEVSQGIAFSLSILPLSAYTEGQDVGYLVGVIKYEKEMKMLPAEAKGNFPTDIISITDEDNFKSCPKVEDEFRGKLCYSSLKMDGSSVTFIWDGKDFRVCSRRLELKEPESPENANHFWRIVYKYDIKNRLIKSNEPVAIQGELCGPKLNGNVMGLKDIELYVFNVKDLKTNQSLGLYGINDYCEQLGVQMVPLLKVFEYNDNWDIARLQQEANELKYSNGVPAEGLVVRPIRPVYSEFLRKDLSVKIINQNYKD